MAYTIELQPDRETVIAKWLADFNFQEEIAAYDDELRTLLDEQGKPLDLIFDMSQSNLGLEDIINAANHAAKASGAIINHPNIRQTVVVSESSLISMAAKGMDSLPFGNIQLEVVPNIEEAKKLLA